MPAAPVYRASLPICVAVASAIVVYITVMFWYR
jgi:hypothetical protein